MHWAEKYIGLPYAHGEADCGRLVCRVQAEVFGQRAPDPAAEDRAASAYGRARQVADVVGCFADPVADPREGDIVLMLCRARPSHVGVYAVVGGEPAVLHAMARPGQAVLTRLRDLPRLNLSVEGYYRWK